MSYIGGFPHLLEPQDFIDPNCTKGIQWIWFVLRECAVSPKEITAVTMGLISTVVWIMFAIPQIVENYRRGIPDQAISPFLLLCFIIGDSLSLTGCFLTNQLVLQKVIAVYSVFCDIIQVIQFSYYTAKHKIMLAYFGSTIEVLEANVEPPIQNNPEQQQEIQSAGRRLSSAPLLCAVGLFCLSGPSFIAKLSANSGPPPFSSFASRQLLTLDPPMSTITPYPIFPTTPALVGYILGWCSAVMYLGSRIPQIIKNWRRQSTEGLSVVVFVFSLIGNLAYGLQIVLTSVDRDYLIRSLPWIVGFPGVIFFDSFILMQFFRYRKRTYEPLANEEPAGSN